MPTMILTRQTLDHILQVYAEQGGAAARKLAPKYGIKPVYVKKLAYKHGVKAKPRNTRPIRIAKRKIKWDQVAFEKSQDALDPRWKLAIERGPVFV